MCAHAGAFLGGVAPGYDATSYSGVPHFALFSGGLMARAKPIQCLVCGRRGIEESVVLDGIEYRAKQLEVEFEHGVTMVLPICPDHQMVRVNLAPVVGRIVGPKAESVVGEHAADPPETET
jgi:hypothetical protein